MLFKLLIGLLAYEISFAAVSPIRAEFKKTNRYMKAGVLVGGESNRDLVLSDVRRTFSAKQSLERIIFEMESLKGKVERVGYFHLAFEPDLNRIVIDLTGVAASKHSLDELTRKLEKSPFVSKASITLDPEDRSATVEIKLKGSGYNVEAFELKKPNESGRMVLDIAKRG